MMRLLCALLLCCFFSPARAQAETITLVADIWCPYNCHPQAEHPGFMIELAQKAFAKHGITVQYSLMPWSRAIEEARKGKFTGIVGASHGDAPDFVFPTIPQGWMKNVFYVHPGTDWRYTEIESLSKISLGVIKDYSYSDTLNNYLKAHQKDTTRLQFVAGDNALNLNVQKLLAGRVDAIVEDEQVMRYYLKTHPKKHSLQEAGSVPPSEQNQLYIAFSPHLQKAKYYAEIIAQETEILRKNGELKAILDVYGTPDWQP